MAHRVHIEETVRLLPDIAHQHDGLGLGLGPVRQKERAEDGEQRQGGGQQDRESSSIDVSHDESSLCLCGGMGRSPSAPQASADSGAEGVWRCMVEGCAG